VLDAQSDGYALLALSIAAKQLRLTVILTVLRIRLLEMPL